VRIRVLPRRVDPPFDLREIVDWLGIELVYSRLPPSVRGFYLRSGTIAAILINSSDSGVVARWTLAHELAHHLNDLTSDAAAAAAMLTDTHDDRWETACEHLAAELLMPEAAIRRLIGAPKPGIPAFRNIEIRDFAYLFEVSSSAMRHRLQAMGYHIAGDAGGKRRL